MKRWLIGACVAACVAFSAASHAATVPNAGIIPAPAKCEPGTGAFTLSAKDIIFADNDSQATAQALKAGLKQRGLGLKVVGPVSKDGGRIRLSIVPDPKANPESYALNVAENGIDLTAPAEAGLFYGAQSILQMVDAQDGKGKKVSLPAVRIEDQPRFGWRGLMLDESRHFFGKKVVLETLDMMAYLKLNRFHWHLTDSPGWRIEIKKYPKLTEVGAIGNNSDPAAPAAFYTQDDIREIVQYARERQIMIIPEIDMPGHATAATKSYPEISGGGSAKWPNFTFNPGKEQTYDFLTDILTEVSGLFPAPYIHLGGDEVSFGNHEWKTRPEIAQFQKDHNLKDEIELEHYFVRRMAGVINGLGKTTMGWDEITSAQVPTDKSVLFWWRHNKPLLLKLGVEQGYPVVLCPRAPCYFDFIQMKDQKVGRKPMFNDLASVYDFPDKVIATWVPQGRENQILGIQACVWSEEISTEERFEYMTYPRLAALAEDAWTPSANKNYDDFTGRIHTFLRVLDKRNINYFDPFNPERTPEPPGPVRVKK